MSILLRDVLQQEAYAESKLVAGGAGIDNIVTNVVVMEVPDIDLYVQESNLIVTTLFPICNDVDAINTLIPRLAEKNVSGICIKPARYIDTIPELMLKQGEELGFPIIELPATADLTKLTMAYLKLSLKEHIEDLNYRNYIHENLMELFLAGSDINLLVDSISNLINKPVVLLNEDYEVIYKATGFKKQILIQVVNDKRQFIVDGEALNTEQYYIYSIKAGKNLFGYLLTLECNSSHRQINTAIEQGALLLASAFYKNKAVQEKERTLQNSFISNLIEGQLDSYIDMKNRGKTFGWIVSFPITLFVFKPEVHSQNELMYELLENLHSKISRFISRKMKIDRYLFQLAIYKENIVLAVNTAYMRKQKTESLLLAKQLYEYLCNNGYSVCIGISNEISEIKGFSEGYEQANVSAAFASFNTSDDCVLHYDECKLFRILNDVNNKVLLVDYMRGVMGSIIDYDEQNDSQLMDTIVALVNANMNMKEASQNLFIHYNTLRYRITKIKEIGVDLETMSITELVPCVLIYLWSKRNDKQIS